MIGYAMLPSGLIVKDYDSPRYVDRLTIYSYLSQLIEDVVIQGDWLPFTFAQVSVPNAALVPFSPGVSMLFKGSFLFTTLPVTVGDTDFETWYNSRYVSYNLFLKDLASVRTEAVKVCFEYMLHRTGEWK